VKVRLTTQRATGIGGDLLKLTGLALEVGIETTFLNRRLSAAQKA
jgi:hypothetical protein